jgi:thiosulfate/3-mercaptopyruvate sulfurtransferase
MNLGPLVSAQWLADHLGDTSVMAADVRWTLGKPGAGGADYLAGHIPGAVFVDLDEDLSDSTGPGRHPLPSPERFAERMGALGIGDETLVVAYDASSGSVAARLWWMLRNQEHPVAVLDGGWQAWVSAGLPVETVTPEPRQTGFAIRGPWRDTADRDQLTSHLGEVVLLDARVEERYRGSIEPVDPVAGHIPTAVSLPFSDLLEDGRLRSPDGLAARLQDAGMGGDQPVVVSCGSGVTACSLSLAAAVAGLPDPLLYPGSWSDWSSAGYPVVTGSDPGEPPPR